MLRKTAYETHTKRAWQGNGLSQRRSTSTGSINKNSHNSGTIGVNNMQTEEISLFFRDSLNYYSGLIKQHMKEDISSIY